MWIKSGALTAFLLMTAGAAAHDKGQPFETLTSGQQKLAIQQIKNDLCEVISLGENESLDTCEGLDLSFEDEARKFDYVVGGPAKAVIYLAHSDYELACTPVKDVVGIGEKRSEQLAAKGVVCVLDLLKADPDEISEIAGVSRARVDQWQKGARVWLSQQEGKARE